MHGTAAENSVGFTPVRSAIGGAARLYRLVFPDDEGHGLNMDLLRDALLSDAYNLLAGIIQDDQESSLKWQVTLFIEFYLAADASSVTDPPVVFRSEPFTLLAGTAVEDVVLQLQTIHNFFLQSPEVYTSQGSGYVVSKFVRLELGTIEYDPIRSGQYIPLPAAYANPMKGLLNVQSVDERCLLYCLVAWWKHQHGRLPPSRQGRRSKVQHYASWSDSRLFDMEGGWRFIVACFYIIII